MAYATAIQNNVVVMEPGYSDSYIPDIIKDAVSLLARIQDGHEIREDGDVRIGDPQFTRNLRLYKAAGADVKKLSATITVNGCVIPFVVGESAEIVFDKYKAESERRSEEYRNSPEGKAQAAASAQRRKDNQRMTDEGFAALRAIVEKDWQEQLFTKVVDQPVGALAATIFSWLASLIESTDFSGVQWDAKELQTLLLELGYKERQYVEEVENSTDINVWRAYVAGQCIRCLYFAPVGFGRIPPFAACMIRERGLDTETFIPKEKE